MKMIRIEQEKNLGKGIVLPVAYDTAWLARVPDYPDTNRLAFPQALDYLRAYQLKDGSWGSEIYNAHGNTLSTLSAIIALTQCDNAKDQKRIAKGIGRLISLAEDLKEEAYETIGFELLLPALLNECHYFNIQLPEQLNDYYRPYQQAQEEKIQLIKKYHELYGDDQPASWWFNLEMIGLNAKLQHNTAFEVNEKMFSNAGSVAASPAATAYLLSVMRYRGKNIPNAETFLKNLMNLSNDQNAIPNVYPIDEFELSFAANYLFDAGLTTSNELLSSLVKQVSESWNKRKNGGLGYSSHFFIDPDCSANGLRALMLAGYQKNLKPDVLLEFFNGECIETYAGERNPSVSSNIHTLMALRLFQSSALAQKAVTKIHQWLRGKANTKGPIFTDKWHFSPIYPTSRAIIALAGLDDVLAQHCIDWLVQNQKKNGAWGMTKPTLEETAFAALSLVFWKQKGHDVDHIVLQKAADFLYRTAELPNDTLWIGKTLYCPQNLICTLIAATSYALKKCLLNDEES